MSSMHRKVLVLAMSAASVAAVASTMTPHAMTMIAPLAFQSTAAVPTPPPAPTAYTLSQTIGQTLARWNSLRQTDNLPFTSYASFLRAHPGWPGETAMRKTAERAIDSMSSPSEIVAYFKAMPPLTNLGHARYAFALLATGRPDEAREEARAAWHGGTLPLPDEQKLLTSFASALTPQDHDQRMEMLLSQHDIAAARRTLPYASAARRPIYDARLAMQTQAPDASAKLSALGASAANDAGVLMDQANWLRNTGQSLSARALLARKHTLTTRPADPEEWFETMLTMARGAANDNQWTMAWQIASQLDDAYPAGTDVSEKSYGERDDYTSLAWLAGTTALYHLNRPSDAVGMFDLYARGARSAQTKSKGYYWAGRAAEAAGDKARADAFYREAGQSYGQFYGQLALERLGQPIPAPEPASSDQPTAAERQAFNAREIVQAARLLGQMGSWKDQTTFLNAIAASLDSDTDRLLAVDFSRQIGRPDLGVIIAHQDRRDGSTDYRRWAFPETHVPAALERNWTIIHAIARQESQFDRQAMSPVGARGLMQLMPGTAREVASKMGLAYDTSRLTSDPDYNIMLGSTYFLNMLDYWGGNYPMAVASYNAGPGNVRKWIAANGDPRMPGVDMVRWIEEIPIYETKNYVQRVLENAVVYDLLNPDRARTPPHNRLSFYLGKSNRPG